MPVSTIYSVLRRAQCARFFAIVGIGRGEREEGLAQARQRKYCSVMRELTRLKAIQAAEAVARHGGFTGASRELGVTPAAVGQMVRSLEDWIGSPLFAREGSGAMRLKPLPKSLEPLREFAQGLDHLEAGLRILRSGPPRQTVVVTISQALVASWLLPNLDDLRRAHPEIEMRLDVSDRLLDLARDEADVGIRCGGGDWSDVISKKLSGEQVIAVASRRLRPKGAVQAWFAQAPLIHDTSDKLDSGVPSWDAWLKRAKIHRTVQRGVSINSTAAAIQAALSGEGVALVRSRLVADALADERLWRPFSQYVWPIRWGYYVVGSRRSMKRDEVRKFHSWLMDRWPRTSNLRDG
jgi:LysR family transcriptional regulator, glycine cleavage system transcriptional activator